MDDKFLFEMPAEEPASDPVEKPASGGRPRLRYAVRDQVSFRACALDDLLPDDHQARAVLAFVERLDLRAVYEPIAAVEGRPGHPPADPRILFALWLYATLRGIGSARELNRQCTQHVAFMWICGDVSMNYHTLSDFRTRHVDLLDRLLTESVASLMAEGLVTLDRVAQDGMKVRASAGAASFRKKQTLEGLLVEAERQVQALRAELEADPAGTKDRQRAARQRAAEEREKRIRQALDQIPQIEAAKKAAEREKARASTTDADARVMKMGDGGFRPAFNVQFAAATDSQVITGVAVTNSGGDQGQMAPMVEQHETRYGQTPDEMLVDGGFAKKEDIDAVSAPQGSTVVFAPVMKSKDPTRDPHEPRADDSPAVAAWRRRMNTDEAKEIYKQRAATVECVNAQARNRGMQRFLVRGLRKVKAVALWYALAHNLMRAEKLRAEVVPVLV
ncbi:MAG: IS1182 family transposase [Mycobacterium sp.]